MASGYYLYINARQNVPLKETKLMQHTRFILLKQLFGIFGILSLLSGIYLSCSEKTDCCVMPPQLTASFDIKGTDGSSVFDSANTDFLSKNSTSLSYLREDGNYAQVYHNGYDNPYGFTIAHEVGTKEYVLYLELSPYTQKDTSFTVLQLGKFHTDTIKALIKNKMVARLWWNDSTLMQQSAPYTIQIKYPD